MSVCCECCVLSGRGLCDKLIPCSEESWLWCVVVCDLETSWMRRPWPTGGCCAKNKQTNKHQANRSTWLCLCKLQLHTPITYQLTNQLTYSINPWSGDLLEKLRGSQPIVRYWAFYGTRRFITAFTRARHMSLWARSIHSLLQSHCLKIHCNITFPSTPGSSKWSLSIRFPHQNPVYTTHSSWFDHPSNILWVQIIKLLIM